MLFFDFVAAKSTAKGWRRHLDGWQAGALVVLLAGSAILLGVPRAAEPLVAPQPRVDARALNATMARDDALAQQALTEELDVDVRALGRELRAYNQAAADGDEQAFAAARQRVAQAANKAQNFGEELVALRAYQLVRFLAELREWQSTGTISEELRALSGDFIETVLRNGWCRPHSRELVFGVRELRALFKKRWNATVGADGEPLALTIDEERVRLGLLLFRPFVPNDPSTSGLSEKLALERMTSAQRLKTIDKLAALDGDYPADLARGVVLFRSGQFRPAADAFRRHLDARPDGPYTLRARNHLKAALDRLAVDAL